MKWGHESFEVDLMASELQVDEPVIVLGWEH